MRTAQLEQIELLDDQEIKCQICAQTFPVLNEYRECQRALCPIPEIVKRARFPVVYPGANEALDELIGQLLEEHEAEASDDIELPEPEDIDP